MNLIHDTIDAAGTETKTQVRGLFEFLTHSDMTFEGKRGNEKIIVFTRRHWFVLLSTIVGGLFAAILPIILVVLGAKILVTYNLAGVFTLLWTIYLMVIWFVVFYKLTMHSLDTWIVTSERVIDISQIGLFRRKVSELHLESIQDVSVNTNGPVQSYFNFGNIEIQTGATMQRFLFEEVPHPLTIKDAIMDATGLFVSDNDKKLG